jgi:hypothetical protein
VSWWSTWPSTIPPAILRHRDEHGPFKSLKDLLAVPGIDTDKIESKQGRLVFRISSGS